jgi:dipeptide/tripeptide permease
MKTLKQQRPTLLGHPAGLWVLFTTEMWERFAFYAMRAILVLYLVNVSTSEQTPGFGWSEADAYKLYGWYTGLVYLSPLLGGWIADRFLGQRFCVVIGAILMALGEFFLAATELVRIGNGVKITFLTDPTALLIFYFGLGLMILGNGFFKPCISVMVGQLYPQNDRRRDSAFTIFYMGINFGAFFSPLIAGTVAENYGYHHGFIIAGIGMICGLLLFIVFGENYLKGIGSVPAKHNPNSEFTPEEKTVHDKLLHEQTRPLNKTDYDRIFVIIVLSIFVTAFWVTFEQAGSSLNIFAKKNTNRTVGNSVLNRSPAFVKDFYLNNETIVDYKSTIVRLEALEEQAKQLGQSQTTQQHEPLGNRFKQLFTFHKNQHELPLVKNYPELVERASGLKERLGIDEDKQVVENLIKVLVEKESLFKKYFGTDEYQNILNDIEKLKTFLKQKSSGLKELLKDNEYKDIVDTIKKMKKTEDSFGRDFVPKKENFTFPATWYQSVNAFGIIIFAPIFTLIWLVLSRYGIEPSTPTKFALGLLLVSASFLIMIPGAVEAKGTSGKAAAYWLVLCYLFATWGELCLSPVGLSMITQLAPARLASFFMGVWFFASSVAYILAGYLASYFGSGDGVVFFFGEKAGLADFFLVMAIIPMVIGFLALALAPKLKRMMHG